ncbi:MAG: molybdopterin-binding protein [Pseudolabrys sp.]|nr:molybdopterin-binding protein [Pseudolabrys sp.]MSP31505.1 molybdopterin-binding protein [Pseudolabrys sp.]
MAAASETIQTIARLTPLADVLAIVDLDVKPVMPRAVELTVASGRTLAADALAPSRPSAALALLDGWALLADLTLGAGGYAPVLLPKPPQRVEVGQPMPPDTDSVAPFDAVKIAGTRAEALAVINPGDGVLPAGGDCDLAIPLRRAGERLSLTDLAAFAAAGIARVTVREPRIRVLPLRGSGIINAAARLVANDIERCGGSARLEDAGRDFGAVLGAESADAIVVIGGTGQGRNDNSVQMLAREARLAVHGIALTPGETAALGFVGPRPVLMLPGRLDAALSVWLVVGRYIQERLATTLHNKVSEVVETLTLARKVTSTIGLAEVVPVRRNGGQAEPLATKYLPLSVLARSDGWILVPADSEGYSAGSAVAVRPWP